MNGRLHSAVVLAAVCCGCGGDTVAVDPQPIAKPAVAAARKAGPQLPCIPTGMTLAEANLLLDKLRLHEWDPLPPDKKMAMLWHLAREMHGDQGEQFWQYRARLYFVLLDDRDNWPAFPKNLAIRPLVKAAADFDDKIKVWRQPEDFRGK
jgi:hypothetical protein